MIEMSTDIGKLAAALCSAQGAMGSVSKDAKNPAFKRDGKALTYATLESVIEAAKPALKDAGLAFTQAPGVVVDGSLEVTTMLVHGESGQWMRSTLHVPLQQRTAQGVGSAITYARRYALMSVLGLPAEDDDGNDASKRVEHYEPPRRQMPDNPFADHPDAPPANMAAIEYIAKAETHIAAADDAGSLGTWWNGEDQKAARRDAGLTAEQVASLKALVMQRHAALKEAA